MRKSAEKNYCIVGASGFARETLTCLIDAVAPSHRKIEEIATFMVLDKDFDEPEIMGIPVMKQSTFEPEKFEVVVAIGDPKLRRKVVTELPPETCYTTIIHPSAIISRWVQIGKGSIVTAGTILTCNITIGAHAHLNLHSTIGHDCVIGDYFTAAPAVNISGNCLFGDCVNMGTNSSVRQGLRICDNVTVGMGGVVTKDIDNAGVYVGNPVRLLSR